MLGRQTRAVFTARILVFGLVGAQMSWILRPFIGAPSGPAVFLRGDLEGNAYMAVLNVARRFVFGP